MLQQKNYDSWAQVSALMALLTNINTDTKKYGVTEYDAYNPYRKSQELLQEKKQPTEAEVKYNFMLLKQVFVTNAPEYKILGKQKKV